MLNDQLIQITRDLPFLSFEMIVAGTAILLILFSLFTSKELIFKVIYVSGILLALSQLAPVSSDLSLLSESFVLTSLGNLIKLLIGFSALWMVFFPSKKSRPATYYFLLLSLLLGSSMMISANQLLLIYLSIELTSFSAYLLTNFNEEKTSFEAGMKYLIFGGVSSAITLYGASLLYGFSGTMILSDMGLVGLIHPMQYLGLILFLGGVLFKVSIVPFHIWVPGTYQEAPTDTVAALSILPKIAGFVLLHEVLYHIGIDASSWVYLLMITLGIFSILIGTFGAIRQTNLKRLVAYGAIAHSGFLLAAVLVPFQSGATAFAFYATIYALMNIGMFYWIAVFEEAGKKSLTDITGYWKKEPWMGALAVILLIALVGLPPTAGFSAKFYLFTAMWEWYQIINDGAMLAFLVVAVLSVLVSLFIYIKIPYAYFLKDSQTTIFKLSTLHQQIIATIFSGLLLWLFFSPKILNNIAETIQFIDW